FETHDYNAGAQLGYDFGTFLGTIESQFERQSGWDFILRATTSLHPYTPDGSYELSSRQRRNDSPIQGLVFLDNNLDGEFDEGDEPLEGVKLGIGNGRSANETNEDGYVTANSASDRLTNFRIDTRSLEDPYFVPGSEGFSTVPARGSMFTAAFPVIQTGAVEGTAYRLDNDRVVSGLTLELIDENNEVIGTSTSGFDGYYTFEFVRPGTYTIRAESSHNVDLSENSFAITPDDLFIYGNDVYVEIEGFETSDAPQSLLPEQLGPFLQDADPAAGPNMSEEVFGPVQEPLNTEAFGPPMEVTPVPAVPVTAQAQKQPQDTGPVGLYTLIGK
ncbi:MAG: carboxypeptidase-like regulatory domain-containing protein, partial [Pseudomonadota bacterium]